LQNIKRYKLIPGQIDSLENLNLLLNEYAKKQSGFNFFVSVKDGRMNIVVSRKGEKLDPNLEPFNPESLGPFGPKTLVPKNPKNLGPFNPEISFTVKIAGGKCEVVGVQKGMRLLVFIIFSAWFMIFSVSALVNGEALKFVLVPILPIIGASILLLGYSPGIKKASKEIIQFVDDFFNEHFEISN